MERRGQENNIGINTPINFTPSQIITESTVKLPLAPVLSTPPDHRRPNASSMVSTRRGSSIFSPVQTLIPPPFRPPPPLSPPNDGAAAPDPDPTPAASNSNNPVPPPPPPTRYKECLKNHAASMGAHVVDGCGEFMPGGDDGTPESLKCAACDCLRTFHPKETDGDQQQPPPPHHHHRSNSSRAPPPPLLLRGGHGNHYFAGGGPAMVSFGGSGAAAESSSEDLNASAAQRSRKRFRTKFSEDQKRRMHEFATKIGWRIQKQDEQQVQQFCGEVGVKRQVFKVWMHNNKQAMKRLRDHK